MRNQVKYYSMIRFISIKKIKIMFKQNKKYNYWNIKKNWKLNNGSW